MATALERSLRGITTVGIPIAAQSWPDALQPQLFRARAATTALGLTGLLAAMLAITGVFGMASSSVSRRTRERGIRMALGAGKVQVIASAVGGPVVLLAVGSVLGLAAGVFSARLLEQIVYRAEPGDLSYSGRALTMALLGVAAAAIPALRALRVSPSGLMRQE